MTPRQKKYEKENRRRKVNEICKHLDKGIFNLIKDYNKPWWDKLAFQIGFLRVSPETIDAIVARYRRRSTRRLKIV